MISNLPITGPMSPLTIDTEDAARNALYDIGGHRFIVRRTPTPDTEITVRMNRSTGQGWNLREGEGFIHYGFEKLYLSWDAAATPGDIIELAFGGKVSEADPAKAQIIHAGNAQDVTVGNWPTSFNIDNFPAAINSLTSIGLISAPVDTDPLLELTDTAIASGNAGFGYSWLDNVTTSFIALPLMTCHNMGAISGSGTIPSGEIFDCRIMAGSAGIGQEGVMQILDAVGDELYCNTFNAHTGPLILPKVRMKEDWSVEIKVVGGTAAVAASIYGLKVAGA